MSNGDTVFNQLQLRISLPFFSKQGQGGGSKIDPDLNDEEGEQGMGDLLGEEEDSRLHLKGCFGAHLNNT